MPPTTFAIFGLGNLGSCMLYALLDLPQSSSFTIHVLTRPETKRSQYFPRNVTFYPIDYSSKERAEEQLVQALLGIQVVISTVGAGVANPGVEAQRLSRMGYHCGFIPGLANQAIVARAAKRAGCSLFLPAEYGSPTHTLDPQGPSFIRGKKLFHLDLMNMRLPYMLMYTGMFPTPEPEQTSLPHNTTRLGETPFLTTRNHAAEFLMQVLMSVPLKKLNGGAYMIRGHRREVLVKGKWKQFDADAVSDLLTSGVKSMSLK